MEWIFIGGGVLVVLALVSLFVWKAKHRPGSVHGHFHFDQHVLLLEAVATLRRAGLDNQARELHQRALDIPSWHRMAILVGCSAFRAGIAGPGREATSFQRLVWMRLLFVSTSENKSMKTVGSISSN